MALPRMPIRDPERSEAEPQHARDYSPSNGGWTRPVTAPKPKPSTDNARNAASSTPRTVAV